MTRLTSLRLLLQKAEAEHGGPPPPPIYTFPLPDASKVGISRKGV